MFCFLFSDILVFNAFIYHIANLSLLSSICFLCPPSPVSSSQSIVSFSLFDLLIRHIVTFLRYLKFDPISTINQRSRYTKQSICIYGEVGLERLLSLRCRRNTLNLSRQQFRTKFGIRFLILHSLTLDNVQLEVGLICSSGILGHRKLARIRCVLGDHYVH